MDYYLTDDRWALIASRVPGKEGDCGCHGRDNRLFIEAVFWMVRTGSHWRRLPPDFGKWYTIYTRYRRWTQKRVWPDVLNALAADETCEYFYEDGKILYAPMCRPMRKQEDPAVTDMQTVERAQELLSSIGNQLETAGARADFAEPAQREFETAAQELIAALARYRSALSQTGDNPYPAENGERAA